MALVSSLQKTKYLTEEWKTFRDRLAVLGYAHAVVLIDSCLSRVHPHIHERRLPPIWWRFMTIDAALDDMSRYFFRMDGEGLFFGGGPDGYVAERDEIINAVTRLELLAAK